MPTSTGLAGARGEQHKNSLALVRRHEKELGGVEYKSETFQTKGGKQHRTVAKLTAQQFHKLLGMKKEGPPHSSGDD